MILEVYEYLLAAYAAALGVASSKGYPAWGRGAAITPCVALELAEFTPEHARIGQQLVTCNIGYRGWLFARHEPELCAMLDELLTWHKQHGTFDIAAQRVACSLLIAKRHDVDPNIASQQEQHAVTFLIKTAW